MQTAYFRGPKRRTNLREAMDAFLNLAFVSFKILRHFIIFFILQADPLSFPGLFRQQKSLTYFVLKKRKRHRVLEKKVFNGR